MKKILNLLLITITLIMVSCAEPLTLRLEDMDISKMESGWGTPQAKLSITKKNLSIAGEQFENGVGTHALSTFLIQLNGDGKEFTAKVGVDDASNKTASIIFYVLGDKEILWESGVMKWGEKAKEVKVDISGVKQLGLLVTDGGDGIDNDHANWAEATIVYKGKTPQLIDTEIENKEEVILTPAPPAEPRINGPKIYGVRSSSPFLYRIPATGVRPMTFSADGLPPGLKLDANTGIITGSIAKSNTFNVILSAKNAKGETKREFKIAAGETLALTPPMGWNSWYIHYDRVSDVIMREAADMMVSTGMADYGYQYVNIDDCWMVKVDSDDPEIGGEIRDKTGKLNTNKRFPDMNAMTDYIHSKGLKAGTYISPGKRTCAGYAGSYGHEKLDAKTFAEWGFDFLKYDWCSYGELVNPKQEEDFVKPYKQMWSELQKQNRNIVFNLCQYGMGEVWKWGGTVGNCWRTTGDLGLANSGSMPSFFNIGMSNARHYEFACPGAWNDPDYILIGWVGKARGMGEGTKTTLSPNEQYAYMSMWSLMAAPLIFSGDMAKLDAFTLNILCNNEVIEINQDILGKQARVLRNSDNEMVMIKELEDGSKAVGLFHVSGTTENPANFFNWNGKKEGRKITVNASELGIEGKFKVRDLWRQKDLGEFENSYEAEVPYHGVMMLKISKM